MPTRDKLPYKSVAKDEPHSHKPAASREKNPDGPLGVPEATRTGAATVTREGAGMQHDPREEPWGTGADIVPRGKADQYEPTPGEQSDDPHHPRVRGSSAVPPSAPTQPLPGAAPALPSVFGAFAPGGDFATLWAAAAGGAQTANFNAATIGRAAAATPATPTALTVTSAADTALTASTEAGDVIFNLAATKQFATGALANQRAFLISGPTYAFVGSSTITNAATVHIAGAPAAGTNATITNSAALWVQGPVVLGSNTLGANPAGLLVNPGQSAAVPTTLAVIPGAGTALTASTEAVDVNIAMNRTVQFATGTLALQRAALFQAPTYGFVGASSLTQAATVAITAAPTAGTNATITDGYALLVQAGRAGFGGQVVGNLNAFQWGTLAFSWTATGDANATLTASQCANVLLLLTGATLSATRNLIVVNPTAAGGFYIVKNGTGGAQSVQVIGTSGTGITIGTGKTALLSWDGTNFIRLTADV